MTEEDFKKCFPFPKERPKQRKIIETVDKCFKAGKKLVILCAPTAIGKSAIGVTLAKYYGDSYMLTSQKSLQDQYMDDFSKQGLKLIKGKGNYPCKLNSKLRCDSGECVRKNKKCNGCTYATKRNVAYESEMMVTNYAYFIGMHFSEFKYHEKRDFMILDECHNTESEVINFMSLTLNADELQKYHLRSKIKFPHDSDSIEEKYKWLFKDGYETFAEILSNDQDELDQLTPGSSEFINITKRINFVADICSKINIAKTYNSAMNNGIVIQKAKVEITFKPLYAKYYAKRYLLDYADKILAMSATVFDKKQFCKDLGVDEKDAVFISCDSPIPSDRRPIVNLDAVNLSYKHKEENKPHLVNVIKEIMNEHKNERGIIHTVSYDIAKYIITNINSDRLVMPKGKERQNMIEYFKSSKRNDLILISPSLTEGISLDDDLSRFTVVCKITYGNLGDPWIKERMNRDSRWYENETIQTLVQMTGRSVRSKEDYAVGYILDSSFNWFYSKTKNRFPKWWKTSLEENE